MSERHEVFANNGVWIRWLVSVLLGLGSVGTTLFYLGQWTQTVNSEIESLQKQDVVIIGRLEVAERTLADGMTLRVKLQKDVEYIREKVDKSDAKLDKAIDLLNSHIRSDKSP
jgi:hypothetical protein